VKWQFNKCKSLSVSTDSKTLCQNIYNQIKNGVSDLINGNDYGLIDENNGEYIQAEKNEMYYHCTNEWYKWSASRFIPAVLTLFSLLLRFFLH
jgi:hypothetical protein